MYFITNQFLLSLIVPVVSLTHIGYNKRKAHLPPDVEVIYSGYNKRKAHLSTNLEFPGIGTTKGKHQIAYTHMQNKTDPIR
jgi:hypothetical protein